MRSIFLPGNERYSENPDNKLENKQNYFRSLTEDLFPSSSFFRYALVGLSVSSSLDSHILTVTQISGVTIMTPMAADTAHSHISLDGNISALASALLMAHYKT